MSDRELIKKTLADLKAAKDRLLKSGHKVSYELQRRIYLYGGGFIKNPRSFDSEMREIIVADMLDEKDFKYHPASGKFVSAQNPDEYVSMKEAVAQNDTNDRQRKELGLGIPPERKKQKEIAVNIALVRNPEFLDEPISKPDTFESTLDNLHSKKTNTPKEIKPDLIDFIAQSRREQALEKQPEENVQREKDAFDGKGIANKELLILNKAKFGNIEDL
jgi:hypothetical protein